MMMNMIKINKVKRKKGLECLRLILDGFRISSSHELDCLEALTTLPSCSSSRAMRMSLLLLSCTFFLNSLDLISNLN